MRSGCGSAAKHVWMTRLQLRKRAAAEGMSPSSEREERPGEGGKGGGARRRWRRRRAPSWEACPVPQVVQGGKQKSDPIEDALLCEAPARSCGAAPAAQFASRELLRGLPADQPSGDGCDHGIVEGRRPENRPRVLKLGLDLATGLWLLLKNPRTRPASPRSLLHSRHRVVGPCFYPRGARALEEGPLLPPRGSM